jgi:hypothetical protein
MRVGLIERFKLLLVDYLLGLCNLSLCNLIFLENPNIFGSQEGG